MEEPSKGETVTPCIYVYKENRKYCGSLHKLKLIIVMRGDLQNNSIIGDTWHPKESTMTLKYFLADHSNNKARANQFYFIEALLQANINIEVL